METEVLNLAATPVSSHFGTTRGMSLLAEALETYSYNEMIGEARAKQMQELLYPFVGDDNLDPAHDYKRRDYQTACAVGYQIYCDCTFPNGLDHNPQIALRVMLHKMTTEELEAWENMLYEDYLRFASTSSPMWKKLFKKNAYLLIADEMGVVKFTRNGSSK